MTRRELSVGYTFLTAFFATSAIASVLALEGVAILVYVMFILPSLVTFVVAAIASLSWYAVRAGLGIAGDNRSQNMIAGGIVGGLAGAASAYLPLHLFADPLWSREHMVQIAVIVAVIPGTVAGIFTGAVFSQRSAV